MTTNAPAPDADPADPRPHPGAGDAPVLPRRTSDEDETGWGDGPSGRDLDWYERERPPHHE